MGRIGSAWLLPLALTCSACGLFDATPTYRYRLAVEVDTPQGLKTGSSVIEVETETFRPPFSSREPRREHRVRGEAAALDLGSGRVLFALLRSEQTVDWSAQILYWVTPDAGETENRYVTKFQRMLERKEAVELPPTLAQFLPGYGDLPARPMMVTFRHLNDPLSVKRVDLENLAATFGEGYALRRITVQLTEDPVTVGIGKRLRWLSPDLGSLDPDFRVSAHPNLSQLLSHMDFRRGIDDE